MTLALLDPQYGERYREEVRSARFVEEMRVKEEWERALPGGRGYRGPRGTAWTGR